MSSISTKDKYLIVVIGPTAVGKTAMGIKLAQHFNTAIISADSRQFFREMSIGTAKPSIQELQQAKHYFIDSHSITELFTPGDFEVQALAKLEEIFKRSDNAIMVGGSGLYVNALCNGLDDLPETDLNIRAQLNQEFLIQGIEPLKVKLKTLDPEYFDRVDQSNTQRIIRGLEFVLSTGKKLSSFHTHTRKSRPFNIIKIGLNTDRDLLYHQINNRVDMMMDSGLLEEVQSLLPFRHLNALKTVGYTELFDFLDQKLSLKEATDLIKQNTRRFAKRQLTWFRKDDQIEWFEPHQTAEIISFIEAQQIKPVQ